MPGEAAAEPGETGTAEGRANSLTLRKSSYRVVSSQLAITPTVTVIIPAMNEAANLPHVFATLPPWIHEVVLVDGRSTDDTVAVARRLLPDVKVVTQAGRGKGDALRSGFEASTGDILVTMDADGSTDGREIIQFVTTLMTGADFVKGSRFACGGGSSDITAARRVGNALLVRMVNVLFGTRYSDLCYGYNAFWAQHLDSLAVDCAGFEIETLLNIRAATAGLRVREVPSFEYSRLHGSSNLRVLTDGWRIAKVIAREWSALRHSTTRVPQREIVHGGAELPAPEPTIVRVSDLPQTAHRPATGRRRTNPRRRIWSAYVLAASGPSAARPGPT
ncbi:MAG: glycosyltransferase family 2 protein [Streptosporangiaceae bacterium]